MERTGAPFSVAAPTSAGSCSSCFSSSGVVFVWASTMDPKPLPYSSTDAGPIAGTSAAASDPCPSPIAARSKSGLPAALTGRPSRNT